MIFWIRVGHTGFMVRTNTVSVVSGGKLEGNSLCCDKTNEWNIGNSFFPFFCRGKSLRGDRKLSCPIYGYLSLPSGPLFCSNIFVGKAPREGNWKMPRKRGEGGEPEAGNEPWDQKESTLRRKTKKGTRRKKGPMGLCVQTTLEGESSSWGEILILQLAPFDLPQ